MVPISSLAVFALQGALGVSFVIAVRRQNVAAAVNAFGALFLALLPFLAEHTLQYLAFGPMLPMWLAVAGFLHSLGMLGLYESTEWWDHLTHTVSAALVAALIYASFLVSSPAIADVGSAVGAVTVAFTFAVGVFWELIELGAREVGEQYDIEPVLIHYGWRDTALDLVFDVVGALVVVAADLRVFVPLVEQSPRGAETVLLGAAWIVAVGSLLVVLFLGFRQDGLRRRIF